MTMRISLFPSTILAAGAIASAALLAPVANADPDATPQSCAAMGASETMCQSPGDAELYDAPPAVAFYPYGGSGGLIGGGGSGGHR
ncbi:hypothetical protein [Mycolicibacterium brisbanense]|nr:hypothetical protein [Mycolicibacterium brisbanense]MCV7161318.1 hypothetical protein [Mycolicibacterium brisbanense]